MADATQSTPRSRDWRSPLALGLAIGMALPIAREVEQSLQPGLGDPGAFVVSMAVAAAVGGLVALVITWLIKPGGADRGS